MSAVKVRDGWQLSPMEWSLLSQYRGALMGLAMIFVMFFHTGGLAKGSWLYALNRCGNVGVDMFLFLSGVGLWFSFCHNDSLRHYYVRRYVRIYPVWLLVAGWFYVSDYVCNNGGQSGNVVQLVANIAVNWCFWQRDAWEFWFIPAIMVMYTFAPFYMRLIRKSPDWRWLPLVAMLFCVMVRYVAPIHQYVSHIEIFWSRIPIFLLGINAGRLVMERRQLSPSAFWLVLLLFVCSLAICMNFENGLRGRFPLFLERMVYIPLSVSLMLLVCKMCNHIPRWIVAFLAFVGSVSLEIYLIHANFVLPLLRPYQLGFLPTALLMIAVSVPAAWVLHRFVAVIVRYLIPLSCTTSSN